MYNISSPVGLSTLNVLITMTGFIVQRMIDAGQNHRLVAWLKSTPFTMQLDTNTRQKIICYLGSFRILLGNL